MKNRERKTEHINRIKRNVRRAGVLLLAAALLLCGCAGNGGSGKTAKHPKADAVMTGIVLEKRENSLLIRPAEQEWLASSNQMVVSIGGLKDQQSSREYEEVVVGETVEVGFSGSILETYPARADGIVYIRRIVADEETKSPLPVVLTDRTNDGFVRLVLDPCGYQLEWPSAAGQEMNGVVADAISPLDENALKIAARNLPEGSEGASFEIASGWPVEEIKYLRWDISSLGNYEADPVEETVIAPAGDEYYVNLMPDSIYDFAITFREHDGITGRADYYLITQKN